MTLNFQNKIVFPAPESSYTTETAYGQVIYIPRNLWSDPEKYKAKMKGSNSSLFSNSFGSAFKVENNQSLLSKAGDIGSPVQDPNDMEEEKLSQNLNDNKIANKFIIQLLITKFFKFEESQNLNEQLKESDLVVNYTVKNSSTSSQVLGIPSTSSQSNLPQKEDSIPGAKPLPEIDVEYIPCLYMPQDDGAKKIVMYFHGNAEDIGLAFDLLYQFGNEMRMHILAVEYPGYGLYKTSPPDETKIKEDADIIFDYLTKFVGVHPSDIILFGRSMGSGPATYLASKNKAFSLLLMSPYTSIKDVSRSLLGKLSFLLTPIVYERFRNIDMMKDARCPVFFLHGLKDRLIPHSHSMDLNQACPMVSFMHLPPNMDHNEFDFIDDLVNPFKDFIRRLGDEQKIVKSDNSQSQQKQEIPKQELNHEEVKTQFSLSSYEIIDSVDVPMQNNQESQEQDIYAKYAFSVHQNDGIITHQSNIDNSFVDYDPKSATFEISFEKKLYEPPKIVIDDEKKKMQAAQQKIASQQKK